MGKNLKSLITRFVRQAGFDLRRYRPGSSEAAQLMKMLSTHRINLVFDVGANAGHFGQFLRDAGFHGHIVSFEPLSIAWKKLFEARRKDPRWEAAPRTAIGSQNGEIEINVAQNSVSSSILPMKKAHAEAAPESSYIGIERVPLRRLDSVATDYLHPHSVVFLKVDTQGYEDQVLKGAESILDRIVGIQLELSTVPLYAGQLLYDDFFALLKPLGFELWAVCPVLVDPQSGRLLQLDATFFRCTEKKEQA
jgi:FkbM family methyltransferase